MGSEQFLDIIAIGAINYDCIFFCDKVHRIDESEGHTEVQEKLNYTRDDVCRLIDSLLREEGGEHRVSVGGSSFNSLRTAREIDKKIQLGFVGVCGRPSPLEIELGFEADPHTTFTFLNNQDWLFFDQEAPGLSCVQVMKSDGNRGDIAIVPGANNNLKQRILEKEAEKGEGAFARYLSRSKWIHISSLADFDCFLFIVEHLKKAKELNPLLQISFDPGFQYTKEYKDQLKEMIGLTDFLFLSQSEFNNLTERISHPGMNDKELIEEMYKDAGEAPRRVIVIKDKAHNVLYRYRNNRVKRQRFRHEQLSDSQILNDTGAGDAFAGGFICGNISERMQLHHPVPMELGARAAIARMEEPGDPYHNIHTVTNTFLRQFENYEFFNDMLEKDGVLPKNMDDRVDGDTEKYIDLSGLYVLEGRDPEGFEKIKEKLGGTGLAIASVRGEEDLSLPVIDRLEQLGCQYALLALLDEESLLTDPEFLLKLGYFSGIVGKEGVILIQGVDQALPAVLQGYTAISTAKEGWSGDLIDALRQIGYWIA